jgi:hypothetical protein
MNDRLNRREFTWLASSGVCGLMANSLSLRAVETAAAVDRDPSQMRLLLLGLNGLARAHEMSYFTDGHRGASMVAAHLLCDENDLPDPARARIEQLFDLNWGATALCKPFPEEEPEPEQVKKIGEALAEADGSLREVGHNAIFAMHAIKAFRMLPSAATPKRIEGVCKLIRAIKPWRDDTAPGEEIAPPKFTDGPAASAFVLREAGAAIDTWTGYGQGFAGHMLTFGQALVELAEMGDEAWAESCRAAFRKYVAVTRKGPTAEDKRIPEHKPNKLRPNETQYWLQRGDKQLGIGHVFKYPYSYYDLLRRVDDAALKREWEEKGYRVF